MARKDNGVVITWPDHGPQRGFHGVGVASGQVGSADAAGKEHVTAEHDRSFTTGCRHSEHD